MLKRFSKNVLIPFAYFLRYGTSFREKVNVRLHVKKSKRVRLHGSHHLYNVEIGDYTYLAKNAYVFRTSIGKYCSIGPNFLCGWGIHPTKGISTSPMFYSTQKQNGYSCCKKNKIAETKEITIGNDVFIGANVTVIDGVDIGDGAIIGAGAVVSKNIPPYAIAVGCPIKIIGYRFENEIINKLLKVKWWENGEKWHHLIESDFFDVEKFLSQIE